MQFLRTYDACLFDPPDHRIRFITSHYDLLFLIPDGGTAEARNHVLDGEGLSWRNRFAASFDEVYARIEARRKEDVWAHLKIRVSNGILYFERADNVNGKTTEKYGADNDISPVSARNTCGNAMVSKSV